MMPLGTTAPSFQLVDTVSNKELTLDELKGERGTLIMFICNHCPFVKHVNPELAQLRRDYAEKGIVLIGISSNDVENYPDDAPDKMKLNAQEQDYGFPYLFDEDQSVARAYDAACTPDFFLFDGDLKCVYRGQLDDSRPGNDVPVTGKDMRTALDALVKNEPISAEQKPSIGCNIKWKQN